MSRPKKNNETASVAIGSKWWIWDSVWEQPREVTIKDKIMIKGKCNGWNTEEVEARRWNGQHYWHQVFSKSQLFPSLTALCDHYIRVFEKFKKKDHE